MTEAYKNWTLDHFHLKMDEFVQLDCLISTLHTIRWLGFWKIQARDNSILKLRNLWRKSLVNQTTRFPAMDIFVNVSRGRIANWLNEIIILLEIPFDEQYIVDGNIANKALIYYQTIQKIINLLEKKFDDLKTYGIFNRQTFEEYYELDWGSG